MSLHADQQSSLPQGGHELAHIGRIRLNALCQLVTGQVAVWVQSDKSQNMNSIAKAGGNISWPDLLFYFDVIFIITTY